VREDYSENELEITIRPAKAMARKSKRTVKCGERI
jgi:hypothetical protein